MNRSAGIAAVLVALMCPSSPGRESDDDALLARARANILENIRRLPNYTCTQTVHRTRFAASPPVHNTTCAQMEMVAPPQTRAWNDRYKLDVTVSQGGEIFSWPGNRHFRNQSLEEVIGADGMTGTGDFGPFLTSIFGGNSSRYEYRGREENLATYNYQVPISASQYQIKVGTKLATVAYGGQFWIDPETAELRHLTIEVQQPTPTSDTCFIDNEIDYRRSAINGSSFVLPESTIIVLLDDEGTRYENRVDYGSCREFHSESVFRTDLPTATGDVPAEKRLIVIPSGIAVKIALRSKIDQRSAFAGDAIEGELVTALQGSKGTLLAPKGAIVHGELVRFEERFVPSHYTLLGLNFDSLEVNGGQVPMELIPVMRSRADRALGGAIEKAQGIGMFLFPGDDLPDRDFISEWKTK